MSDNPAQSRDGNKSDHIAKGETGQSHSNEGDDGDVEEPQVKLDKASAQNAADLERVTDVSEEKEFSGGGNASAVRGTV